MASEVFKRTPVRLAAIFTALFVATALVVFAGLYVELGRELEKEIRSRVEETADALAAVGREKGFNELADLIESEADTARNDTVLLLIDEEGRFRAGNVRHVRPADSWITLPRADLIFVSNQGRPDDVFLARWFPVTGGRLLVGIIDREIRKTRLILLDGLLWALAGTVLVAGLSSALLAWRAQARIAAIATTLEAVKRGQLDVRVAMSGSGDDMDHIGEEINRTLNQLKSLVDNVNQSSSDIAHDLKKPMGRLQRHLDEARRSARTPEEFRAAIDVALNDLDSIVETFEALLSIAQIEAGARRSRFRPVDLREVIAEIGDVYEAVAEDNGQCLSVADHLACPAKIFGDSELLVQLVANLIENAIQHCPRGTTIELGLATSNDGYTISVADNGPGIPPEERANVLRRLYRLERARSTPGSGLGLSLAAAISDLHSARLRLDDNRPGLWVGVTFPASDA